MKYILFDRNQEMIDAWNLHFENCADVELICADFNAIDCDTIVSPANSFGFMDGGIDYAISDRLGWDLQDRLQEMIHALPEGELLVGKALLLETGDASIPFLISAPTMRVPTNFNISTSINAYLAMKATLIVARSNPAGQRVAIPGFCTGTGGMNREIAAGQMFAAYQEIVLGQKMRFPEYGDAQRYQWRLNTESLIWTH